MTVTCGVELVIEPGRARLSPAQVRRLAAQAVRTARAHREYEQALDRGHSAVLLARAQGRPRRSSRA